MRTTRRMWSRRLLRAGWLIAPLFTFPATVRNWVRGICWRKVDWVFAAFMAGVVIIGSFFAAMINKSDARHANALPAELSAASKDPCMSQQIAHELSLGFPVSRYDLEVFSGRCADAKVVRAQLEVIK